MDVRRAGPADLPQLLPLVAEFCAVDGHDQDEARAERALVPLLADDGHGQVWVLDDGTQPGGYAVVTWGWSIEGGGLEALLDEIYVRRRGDGAGGALLERVLQAAAAAGASRIFLETERPNDAVRRFYARHGFRIEPSIWMQREL